MLKLTEEAARAIRELTDDPVVDGIRLHTGPRFQREQMPPIQIDVVPGPDVEDTVLEAEGARIYVDQEALELLEDKVLDAKTADGGTRFALLRQAREQA